MKLELKGLLIDSSSALLEELEKAFGPDIEFDYLDCVNSVHKAITYHMDMDFNICFFGESFPVAEVKIFHEDYKKLNKKTPCVFVQLRDAIPIDFDRTSLKEEGFDTVVTLKGDFRDKNALWDVLKLLIDKSDRDETLKDLDSIVENLMSEVDRVAKERKRGSKAKLGKVWSGYIQDKSKKFKDITEKFYDKLADASAESDPFAATKVAIPDEVLAKNLPHLYRERYKGQSHRVWEKLLNKHGVSDKNSKEEPVKPDSAESDANSGTTEPDEGQKEE